MGTEEKGAKSKTTALVLTSPLSSKAFTPFHLVVARSTHAVSLNGNQISIRTC